MTTTIKVTNESLFNANVLDVDCEALSARVNHRGQVVELEGLLAIETKNGWKEAWGQFSADDYEAEFGFVFVAAE